MALMLSFAIWFKVFRLYIYVTVINILLLGFILDDYFIKKRIHNEML